MGFRSRETAEQPHVNAISLMDECKSMNGCREALATAVLAFCVQASAADPAVPDGLRNFLKDGWGVTASTTQQTDNAVLVAPDPVSISVPPIVQGPVDPLVTRSGLKDSRVPVDREFVAASSGEAEETAQTESIDQDQKLGTYARPIFETLQIDRAPSVKRLVPGFKSNSVTSTEPVGGIGMICAADPIDADQLTVRAPGNTTEQESESNHVTCDLVTVPDSSAAASANAGLASIPQQPAVERTTGVVPSHGLLSNREDVAAFFSGIQKPAQDGQVPLSEGLLELPLAEFPFSDRKVNLVAEQREPLSVPSEIESVVEVHHSRGMIENPLDEVDDSLSRAAGFWELAERSLQQARDSAGNKIASESRDFAFETFRLCVAAIDAAEQTGRCMEFFQTAMDAVRESEDFCKSVDGMSQSELHQLIAAHQTSVMKGVAQSELSSHDAAFRYMTFARCKLVEAASGMPEASEALMLLGAAEAELLVGSATYKHAIAVMLQRAAIEINPANHATHLALGKTLSKQGLSEQACWSLHRSVEIRPTKEAYQALLEIATQGGNDAQMAGYLAELQKFPRSSELFSSEAAGLASDGEPSTASSGQKTKELSAKGVTRSGWRSLIPFMR